MKINGITLTNESLKIIRQIQESDSSWMIDVLEDVIDATLESGIVTLTDKQKLKIIDGVRYIIKNVISVLADTKEEGGQP